MKILLIGNSRSYLATRLAQETKLTDDEFLAVNGRDIRINLTENGFKATLSTGQNLLLFDVFYFYALGRHLPELAELAKFLKNNGKIIVEDCLANGALPLDKLVWSEQNILPTPNYQFFFHFRNNDYDRISYPAIVKTVHDSCGRGIFKVANRTELREAIKRIGRKIIIQDYLPIDADYRVLVIGDQALGAVKRFNQPNDFLTTRAGGLRSNFTLPAAILKLSVEAVRAKGLEIAGLDLALYQDKYYLWEINSSPQCRSFEKHTGLNVASAILNYLKNKKT